jgi:hypothetical protein
MNRNGWIKTKIMKKTNKTKVREIKENKGKAGTPPIEKERK